MKPDREKFYREIYSILRQIPPGSVCTYGLLARLVGEPRYARLAGKAVAEAPVALELPCHRIVNSQGRLVPHWPEQRVLLEREGVIFRKNGAVDLKRCLWETVYLFIFPGKSDAQALG